MKDKTPITQSITIGSTAAIIEASINHPLWIMKIRVQAGNEFTLNPKILYRGLTLHMLSRIPATAMQMTFSQLIQEHAFPSSTNKAVKNLTSGLLGGGFAALLLGPTELVMTYQHKFDGTFWKQGASIYKNRGLSGFFTGYTGTAVRLGTYTSCFFAAQPMLKEKIEKDGQLQAWEAHVAASVITGSISTVISNPNDIIKTIQQDTLPKEKLSISEVATRLYQKHGVYGFFKGVPSRAARVCSGIAIISCVKDTMEERLYKKTP